MKNIKSYLLIALVALLFLQCKKDKASLTGTFVGTFTVTYPTSTSTGATTVTFTNSNQYSCTGNSNYVPAGGSGTFSVSGNTIHFTDINYWTANFDGNLILNGDYDYTFDGTHLKFQASKNNVGVYSFDLMKQ